MWKQILGLLARLDAASSPLASHPGEFAKADDTRQGQLTMARKDLVATRDAVDKASLRMWLDNKGDPMLVEQLECVSRQLGDDVKLLETAPETWWHLRAHHQARLGQANQLLLLAGAAQAN